MTEDRWWLCSHLWPTYIYRRTPATIDVQTWKSPDSQRFWEAYSNIDELYDQDEGTPLARVGSAGYSTGPHI